MRDVDHFGAVSPRSAEAVAMQAHRPAGADVRAINIER